PFAVPTIVAGMAWVSWLGRSGFLAQMGLHLDLAYRFEALILAHVFFNLPWVAFWISKASAEVPQNELDAAETLGTSAVYCFCFVIWPRIKWVFASATLQVFMLCVMSFALVLVLGGGPPVQTLETALYSRMRYGSVDLNGAMACALWQLAITAVPWIVLLSLKRRAGESAVTNPNRGRSFSRQSRFQEVLFFALALFFVVPYLAVFSGLKWPSQIDEIQSPLWISLQLALGTAAGSCVVALLAVLSVLFFQPCWRGRVSTFLTVLYNLPSSFSVLVLGLGVWIAYSIWMDPFEGSLLAMLLLQVTLFAPIAFRVFWPIAHQTQHQLLDAAQSLGASPLVAFRFVEFPRWRGPLLSAFAMVAAAALGEVAAVSLFYSEKLVPLPLVISRWMGQYRFEEAQFVSALLLLVSMGVMVAVYFLGGPEAQGCPGENPGEKKA
ncbi:ABC transporter permease subunit, partial [Bdellovibrionota bacterium FG-2]